MKTQLSPSFNLTAYVLDSALPDPNKVALIIAGENDQQWTYGAIAEQIARTANRILQQGLIAGDKLLMRVGNTVDFPVVFLAAIAVGIIPIATSAQLTKAEVTQITLDLRPKLVIAQAGLSLPETDIDVLPIEQMNCAASGTSLLYQMGNPNRPAYIIYTSGTSGSPQAVLHSHRAIWARQAMFDGWYGMTANDRVMHAGAFNWTYTLGTGLLDPWTLGATAIIPEENVSFDQFTQILHDQEATIFAAVPGVYRKTLNSNFPTLPKLRHGLSAGEKLPQHTANKWLDVTGTPIYEAFGMSECSTFISGSPCRPALEGSLGYIQTGRSVDVLKNGATALDDETGVISIKDSEPGLMLGYLSPDGVCDLPLKDGWFETGDLAKRAPDGSVIYMGRNDDMMNAGGYRVSPLEVEAVLSTHDDIQDFACCEVTVKTGTTVIAGFYTSENLIPNEQLEEIASSSLAKYKRPRFYVRVETLPRGRNNKLMRHKLRQYWEAENGQT